MDETKTGASAKKDELIDYLRGIAFGRSNDAVKLAFLKPEQARGFGKLDLTLLSEVRHGANGVTEVKLLDRLEAVSLLAQLLQREEDAARNGAESFFRAMDRAAGRLGEEDGNDAL